MTTMTTNRQSKTFVGTCVVACMGVGAWAIYQRGDSVPPQAAVTPNAEPSSAESVSAPTEGSVRVEDDPAIWLDRLRQGHRVVFQDRKTSATVAQVALESMGVLTPDELMALQEHCQSECKGSQASIDDLLRRGATKSTSDAIQYISAVIGLETGAAKSQALLDGSYILLPPEATPPSAILRHPDIHTVCTGGTMHEGKSCNVWITIDLKKATGLAKALDDYRSLHSLRSKELITEFNAFPEAARKLMTARSPAASEGMKDLLRRIELDGRVTIGEDLLARPRN